MPIEIIVEDGTGTINANSYASVIDARKYAADRNIELPASDDIVAGYLIEAMDFLESKALLFQGESSFYFQSLTWPRAGVIVGTAILLDNVVPKNIIKAQCALVIALNQGLVLMPNLTPQDYVIEEKVDVITTKYADPSSNGGLPTFTGVDALLLPFFKPKPSFSLRTIRV